jgi:type I restriction enzyme S subunit
MKRYPAYKDSGVDWIGDVPEEWDMKKVKFLVDLIVEKAENSNENEFKVALENIESFTGMYRNGSEMFEGVGNYFKKGDVLFNKLRPYLAKVFVALNDGVAVGELLVLRPKYDYEQKFLFFRFLSSPFISTVNGATYGSKMPRANWDLIGNIKVPTPNKENQKVIVKYLDHKTRHIDTLIEKKQKQIQLLQEQRTAIINHAVTKGLNPNVKMKDTGIEWMGEVPEHWELKPLKYIVTLQRGHDLPSEKRVEGDIPVISSAGATGLHNQAIAKAPGIVTGRYGTIGIFYLLEQDYWPLNTTLYSVNLHGNLSKYLWYLLRTLSPIFLLNSSKSAVPGIDRNDIHPTITAIPPSRDEQFEILHFLEQKISQIETAIATTQNYINLLKEYRTTLISEVVTGKIDVRDEVIP